MNRRFGRLGARRLRLHFATLRDRYNVELLNDVLDDYLLDDAIGVALEEKYREELSMIDGHVEVVRGSLGDFINWVLDNPDKVMAIVKAIMVSFSRPSSRYSPSPVDIETESYSRCDDRS